jgi:endonuclease YncB( thermonuclease family)
VSALHAQNTEPAKSGAPLDFSRDPCGNPMMESMVWHAIEGNVSRVVDGHTILLTLADDHQILRVHLAGIAPEPRTSFSKKAREVLSEKLLNKAVEVWVNPDKWDFADKHPEKVTGVVHLTEGIPSDVGLLLLGDGLVRFKLPRPYTMSAHTSCQYRLAEAEAQSKKLGLWQYHPETDSGPIRFRHFPR